MNRDERSSALSDDEIAPRRDAALRRALNTLLQPKHGKIKESNPAHSASPAEPRKRGHSRPRRGYDTRYAASDA